jgi:hypothetical protein
MSTLHANTIETSAGGPVTLTQANTSKAWMGNGTNYNNGAGIDQSLNVSSQTDNGVGKYHYNLTNAFLYEVDAIGATGTCGQATRVFRWRNNDCTTSVAATYTATYANADVDTSHNWSIVGDLA